LGDLHDPWSPHLILRPLCRNPAPLPVTLVTRQPGPQGMHRNPSGTANGGAHCGGAGFGQSALLG
jgi:hypothetical protein